MSELSAQHTRPTDLVGRVLFEACRALALLGGVVLCAMALMTTISVFSRFLTGTPIPGDFELIAIGTGVAIFAFLPYCQMVGENVLVDFFLERAPDGVKKFFDALGSLIYGLIIALLACRTTLGGVDIYENNETTIILEFQYWTVFPFAVLCLALLCAVCIYTFCRSVKDMYANGTS